MPKQQKTFDLVPVGPVYDGPRRAMTSKQAKREYKNKNKAPTISYAEERRLEKEELDQQKRNADRERAASKAKWVREKKAAKVLAERNERKRLGLPEPSREVRAGQPLISMFVNKGAKRLSDEVEAFEEEGLEIKKARLELESLSESDFLELTKSELAESFGADGPLASINQRAKRTSDELEALEEAGSEIKARLELEGLSEQDLLELTNPALTESFGADKPLTSIDKGVKRSCDELEDSEKADREFKKARLELESLSEQDFLELTNSELAESFGADEPPAFIVKGVKRTRDELEASKEPVPDIKKTHLDLQDVLPLDEHVRAGQLLTTMDQRVEQPSENLVDAKETATPQRVFKELTSPHKQVTAGQPLASTSSSKEATPTPEITRDAAKSSTDSEEPQLVVEVPQQPSRPIKSAPPPTSKGKKTDTKGAFGKAKKVEKVENSDTKVKKPRQAFKNALQPTKLVKAGQSLPSPFLQKGPTQTAEAPETPAETAPTPSKQRRALGELDPNSLGPIAG